MTDQHQPSRVDKLLEIMRRLAGAPKNDRFGAVVRGSANQPEAPITRAAHNGKQVIDSGQ